MPSNYTDRPRDKHGTFRTHAKTWADLGDLSKKVNKLKWYFPNGSVIRKCENRSALVHHIVSGHITLSDIKEKIAAVKAKIERTQSQNENFEGADEGN